MAQTILHKRGLKENLPELLESEIGFTLDTKEVFIGTNEGNKRLVTDDLNDRTIVFVVPGELMEGARDPHIVLPFDAKILDIKAYVSSQPSMDLRFNVEYSTDYTNWISLTEDPIQINANSSNDNGKHVLSTTELSAETMLRINIVAISIEARNLTVNIKVLRK